MDLYYKVLMYSLKMVTGDKEVTTWTFHKGCLRILGNDWVSRKPRTTILRFLWTGVYPASYTFLLAVSVLLTVKYAIQMDKKETIQFIRGTNGFIVSITYVYAAAKALLFKFRRSELQELMDMLDDLGEMDDVGRPHRDRVIFKSTLYLGLLFIIPGTWTIYFVLFHDALPPYPTEFPWDDTTFLGYLAAFGTDFVTAVYCAALHSVYDTLFPIAVGSISAHLASLKNTLSKLGSGQYGSPERDVLRDCYRKHVSILRVISHMNSCFRLIFLVQTTYTVIHACVIIYQVMQVSDIFLAIMNTAPMLSSAYFQLLMYCYYGQLLTVNFEGFKASLYDNNWYLCGRQVQSSLVVMTLVANRPVQLISYGITSAAHPTFLSSLQDSISYYLILKTVTAG